MSTYAPPRQADLDETDLSGELRHIRDLVFVRELLRERGTPATELRECDAAIDQARANLAAAAKRAATGYGAAA